jgi:zinc protease
VRRAAGTFLVAGCVLAPACSADVGVSQGTAAPIGEVETNADPVPSGLPGLLDSSDEPIPNDDEVVTGALPNGLVYYVRENDRPGGSASLRLAIRAGSVNETGAHRGVAHFVEHMLFNGTEQFPENELIDVLRGFGASFGADINAYTSFDETVYQLDVPNDGESFDTAMQVLEQWLSHATIDPAQVEAERGIILDEWRTSTQTVDGRLFDVAQRLYLGGSAYDGRDPIGTDTAIRAVPAEELRQFYDDWYRPDNAAVVVVGDVDADDVVARIVELFGPAVARTPATPARPDTSFPIETVPAFALHADPDQTSVDVEVDLPLPAIDGNGTAALRTSYLDQIVSDALVRRLDQDVSDGTAPFDGIVPGTNSLVAGLDAPALYAFSDAGRARDTLQALLDEYERAARHGFADDEIVTAKSTLSASLDAELAGRGTVSDPEYADRYVEHFLYGTPFPDIEDVHEQFTALIDAITPDAVATRFLARWANTAPHVIISTPIDQAPEMPSEADVISMIGQLSDRDVAPREAGRALPDDLMIAPAPVTPDSIDEMLEGDDPFLDPIEITFPNGARVIATSNDIVDGQVLFQASSPGGTSLLDDADVVDALFAADVVFDSGVGDFDQAELEQILADRDVQVGAWMAPYDENLWGSAGTADLEVLFQLVHLYVTAPRVDPVSLANYVRFQQPFIDDPGSDPDAAGYDALVDTRYSGELRYTSLPSPEQFATLDADGIARVWADRYGNAGDFVFVLAGDLDLDEVVDLASTYIGTLPGTPGAESWVDVEQPPPPGAARIQVAAGTGDTASMTLLFTTPVDAVDGGLRANIDVAAEVLNTRLNDVVREQLGESYSPTAFMEVRNDPDPVIETYVSVTGAPDRIEAVGQLVVQEFADLALNGPTAREFDLSYAQVEEAYGFVDNQTFVDELINDAIWPGRSLDEYFDEYGALGDVTAATVRALIVEHVPADQYIEILVVPR